MTRITRRDFVGLAAAALLARRAFAQTNEAPPITRAGIGLLGGLGRPSV